jgi:DNA-binding Lrp family transcriptional regulator
MEQKKTKTNSWTFFTNHTHVLVFLELYGSSTIKDLAISIGITERAVQNIIYDLEENKVISKTKVGRNNEYSIDKNIKLRHPLEKNCSIGDILKIIVSKNKYKTS